MTTHVFGLVGYAEHGKDSIANVLEKHFGFYPLAFGDAVKEMALACNPLIPCGYDGKLLPDLGELYCYRRLSDLISKHGWQTAKKNEEIRRFMQNMATEGVRDVIDQDAWVNVVVHKVNTLRELGYTKFVVKDVRFPDNEAIAVTEKLHGTLFGVNREGHNTNVSKEHSSEKHVPELFKKCKNVFQNNGTLTDLELELLRYFDLEYHWQSSLLEEV